ncbi:MAG: YifB family Mg chelatase-like AAA ATPase [Heliobacteriaceae bacterium]|nr:YifB family Mg chelatase-like AAA ATPase [Heliobacteriaceae bacterium]MDD4588762.1 YifB family Mg chelatase-like AAA ATPase [Heliobacteriaceae bacterium]
MATVINGFAIVGIDGYQVEVETKNMPGVPSITVVGLGDTAVKEARQRVEAALQASGFQFPKLKIVINLAPGDVKKSGSHFDLPMAVGLLAESNQLVLTREQKETFGFLGELSLNGLLRPCSGVLPMAIAARAAGLKSLVVPAGNVREAALVKGLTVYGFYSLGDLAKFLSGETPYLPVFDELPLDDPVFAGTLDFSDVVGQDMIIDTVVAAAAGGHNILFIGAPGCGKSMIAKRLPTILPTLTEEEALEVTKIYSVVGQVRDRNALISHRPFRAPHHNASLNALIGGGSPVVPGEVSLAHHGVLFLDEIAEFNRKVLDALRQPLEDKQVTVARVKNSVTYPCNFMLVSAMNPCPCGYYGQNRCRCTDYEVLKYRQKISGPILDRIDLQKYVQPVDFMSISGQKPGRSSAILREQVETARKQQRTRFAGHPAVNCNAQMTEAMVREFCTLDSECTHLLQQAYERFRYSARSFNKFLKVARTYADLDGLPRIGRTHITAALMARDMDKEHAGLLVV